MDYFIAGRAGRLLAAIIAAGVIMTVQATSVSAQDAIRFGASLSLTGRLATEGRLVKEGYDFYVKHVNQLGGIDISGRKYKVEIVYYDDQSDANTAVKLVEKLISEDGIKFLLGPYSSGATLPVSSVNERHKLPMVVAHAAASTIYERGYKYIFATLTSVDQYTLNIVKMGAEIDPKMKVALINENALFPQLGIEAAAAQAKQYGLQVVYQEKYPTGTKDLSSILAKMKSNQPDMIMAGGYTGDMILLARQIKEVGLKPKILAYLLGPTLPGFVDSLKQDAENVLEPIQWSPSMPWKDPVFGWTAAEFAQLFEREYGHKPDYHPPQSAAALLVYHHAFQKARSLDPQKVRDAIAQTDIMTFYGPVKFNEKGQNIAKGMAVVQIQKGKPVVVYPKDTAEAKLVYPAVAN